MTHPTSPHALPRARSCRSAMPGLAILTAAALLAGCAGLLPASPGAPAVAAPSDPDALGLRFVRIPAGRFTMGSDETADALARDFPQLERRRLEDLADESPAHPVTISRAFEMAVHEVTVGQFRRFLAASGHVPQSVAEGSGAYGYRADYDPATSERGDAFEGRLPRYSWAEPGFAQGDDHPVVNVSWHDAQAMAGWLSRREGRTYRLPTEAEWEYACRAGGNGRYGGFDAPAGLAAVANTFDRRAAAFWPRWADQALPADDGHAFTAPVGRYPANAFGVHDLLGNVWEWVSDRYDDTAYARGPATDPTGPAGPGELVVRRGGSWHTWAIYARCGYRNINTTGSAYPLLGFRLVRELPTAR